MRFGDEVINHQPTKTVERAAFNVASTTFLVREKAGSSADNLHAGN